MQKSTNATQDAMVTLLLNDAEVSSVVSWEINSQILVLSLLAICLILSSVPGSIINAFEYH